jgi:hypothetical protein
MRFIEELVVEEFLPTFRSMLAEALRERDLTQSEVAELLGISQSAVSKYVHGDVERNERLLAHEGMKDLVDQLADGLASGEMSRVQALVEAEVFVRQLERGGLLAQLHEEAFPPLSDSEEDFVDIHDPDSALRQSERIRASVRRGLRILENTSGFASLIPAVGSNLAECLPDAEGIDDVAAVPGRILDLKGRAEVPGEPEFGVSEYSATVLLTARELGSSARATLNIRYDAETVEALEAMGYETVEFDADQPLEAGLADAFADRDGESIDVVYQTGGFGVEPIIYLLGADATTVARTVRELLRE